MKTASELTLVTTTIGWSLLHCIWQSLIIYIALFLAMKTISHATARIKYHLHVASLIAIFALFLVTLAGQWQRLHTVNIVVTENYASSESSRTYTIAAKPEQNFTEHAIEEIIPNMERAFPWLVVCYMAGMCLMFFRFSNSIAKLMRLRYSGISQANGEWSNITKALCERMKIRQKINLFFSEKIQTPLMVGIIRPAIILPVAIINQLSIEQTEAILLHELAHIKRRDYLINIFQIVAETILFFNPVVWKISETIRREREHCCDDLVLANTDQPLSYASALTALEAGRQNSINIALAATGKKQYLFHRIKRIMEMKKQKLNYSRLIATILIVVLFTGAAFWLSPTWAQTKKSDKKEQKKTAHKIIVREKSGDEKEYDGLNQLPENIRETIVSALATADSSTAIASEALKNIDVSTIVGEAMSQIDWEKTRKEIAAANKEVLRANAEMKKTNHEQIQKETTVAMAEAKKAMTEANVEMQRANEELKKINWDSINQEMKEGLKELQNIHWDSLNNVIQNSMAAVRYELNSSKAQAEMQKKEAEQDRTHANKEFAHTREATAETRAEDAHSRTSSANFRKMIFQMQDDHLLSENKGFAIKNNEEGLFINNKKQSKEVAEKYRHFFTSRNTAISGNEENISISVSD